jgi:hypothetical protein
MIVNAATPEPLAMSRYERARWDELLLHWEKKAKRRELLPPKARAALETTGRATRRTASRAGRAIADATPEKVKDVAGSAVDAALVPTVSSVAHMLELLNDWVVELTGPEVVMQHHRDKGREVSSLHDLRLLDLEELEEDHAQDGPSLAHARRWSGGKLRCACSIFRPDRPCLDVLVGRLARRGMGRES